MPTLHESDDREPRSGAAVDDPLLTFQRLYERAQRSEPEPTAVALATADASGQPSVRMLLLKGADAEGFVFYSNYESRKGRELLDNPRAALCFYWKSLETQVRVEGAVERVSAAESDAYFASRPRGSQLGAWASLQSQALASREALEQRIEEVGATYGEDKGAVPRPPRWGGYRLRPTRIEFWFAHPYRLHDRFAFTRAAADQPWQMQRLYP